MQTRSSRRSLRQHATSYERTLTVAQGRHGQQGVSKAEPLASRLLRFNSPRPFPPAAVFIHSLCSIENATLGLLDIMNNCPLDNISSDLLHRRFDSSLDPFLNFARRVSVNVEGTSGGLLNRLLH